VLDPIGTLITAINTSAIAVVVPAVLILGLIWSGLTYILGHPEQAQSRLKFTFWGGGIALMSTALATAIKAAAPH